MTNLTRFVARDGQPIAIYHATFADSHPESGVLLAVGIGADWNEVESCERVAFACRLWINGDDYVTTIMDRADSPCQFHRRAKSYVASRYGPRKKGVRKGCC